MIHGRNLIVALDGVAVAAAKTCSMDIDQNFLEACSPVSGRTHTKIPTTYNWGVSVDGLVANNSSPTVSLQDLLIAGTKCLLTFTDGSGNLRAGYVYVKSCKESGSVGGLATFSASFESTGELYDYEIKRTEEFNEGHSVLMDIVNGQIILDGETEYNIYGVQISGADKVILIADDDIVAITNAPFNAAMKEEIYYEDPQIINANLIYAATTEPFTVVDLDRNKTYTVLTNYTPYKMILLRRIK